MKVSIPQTISCLDPARQAKSIILDIQRYIDKASPIFRLTGLAPTLSLNDEEEFNDEDIDLLISGLYIKQILKDTPCLSLASRAVLEDMYAHINVMEQQDKLETLRQDIWVWKQVERARLITWLKNAESFEEYNSDNKLARLVLKPKSVPKGSYLLSNDHKFEILSLLQAFIADHQGDELATKLIGQVISDSCHQLGEGKTAPFSCDQEFYCPYFSFKTEPNSYGTITLNPRGASLVRQMIAEDKEGNHASF